MKDRTGNIIQSLNRETKREVNNNKYITATSHKSKGERQAALLATSVRKTIEALGESGFFVKE